MAVSLDRTLGVSNHRDLISETKGSAHLLIPKSKRGYGDARCQIFEGDSDGRTYPKRCSEPTHQSTDQTEFRLLL
jgi:hypothetical protein